jgi:hypothetical protein
MVSDIMTQQTLIFAMPVMVTRKTKVTMPQKSKLKNQDMWLASMNEVHESPPDCSQKSQARLDDKDNDSLSLSSSYV